MGLMLIDWCALALVVFIGLPHGALDAAISFSMISSSKRIARLAGLLLIYLLLAIAIFLIWDQLPAFSLLIFLLISIVHFGMADFNACPTSGPTLLHMAALLLFGCRLSKKMKLRSYFQY